MKYTPEQKDECHKRFLAGENVRRISAVQSIEPRTLYNWIAQEKWTDQLNKEDSLYTIRKRIRRLLEREGKEENEIRELDRLLTHLEAIEKINMRAAEKNLTEAEGKPVGGTGKSKKRAKNDFRGLSEETVLEKFREGLFEYQLELYAAIKERTRTILKSRQIGATYYFAREALTNAILTGDNQIFLSASRAQADVFREYIRAYAFESFGVELKGKDKIEILTDHGTTTLYFLSTNSNTAQSYHGHLYIDEFLWIPKFDVLKKVAGGMAAHKKWRTTYFSTPSSISHPGWSLWTGEAFNIRRRKQKLPDIEFPSRSELRKTGILSEDGIWRRCITLADAEKGGCDLFDINQLHLEYSDEDFAQLFMCDPIDDTASVFPFSVVSECMADVANWRDVKYPDGDRNQWPEYAGAVAVGYDPSRTIDGASIIVAAMPKSYRGLWRVILRIKLHHVAWQYQANTIKEITQKYNVEHIAVDRTGNGDGVFEMVSNFFPKALPIFYSPQAKTRLVLKMQQIFGDKRIQWPIEFSDIPAGFMQIKRSVTEGTSQITYTASRSKDTGHADSAFAVMHALTQEDFILPDEERECTVAFSD